jgi:hypothetical protein
MRGSWTLQGSAGLPALRGPLQCCRSDDGRTADSSARLVARSVSGWAGPEYHVSGSGPPAGAGGDVQAVTALGDALDRVGAHGIRVLAEVAVLLYAHPRWAIWLPVGGREWTAVRPAGSIPPGPEVPTIWVHAETAGQMAVLMQRADAQLSGGAVG